MSGIALDCRLALRWLSRRRGLAATAIASLAPLSTQLGKTLESLLIGIQPRDTVTLAVGALLALMPAGAASLLPAARASRIEPSAALRSE